MRIVGVTNIRITFKCSCGRVLCRGKWLTEYEDALERERNGYDVEFRDKTCPECKKKEG